MYNFSFLIKNHQSSLFYCLHAELFNACKNGNVSANFQSVPLLLARPDDLMACRKGCSNKPDDLLHSISYLLYSHPSSYKNLFMPIQSCNKDTKCNSDFSFHKLLLYVTCYHLNQFQFPDMDRNCPPARLPNRFRHLITISRQVILFKISRLTLVNKVRTVYLWMKNTRDKRMRLYTSIC